MTSAKEVLASLPDQQLERLAQIRAATGLSNTALARQAGIAASTLNRFVNGDVSHALSAVTMAKIEAVASSQGQASVVDRLDAIDAKLDAIFKVLSHGVGQ